MSWYLTCSTYVTAAWLTWIRTFHCVPMVYVRVMSTRLGGSSPIPQHLLSADQVESSPSSDTTSLGPSEDAHLVMGVFISGSKASTLFQNSLAVVLPLYSHTLTNITFPKDVSILPSHRSPNAVTHMTELCLLNSASAVNIHRLLEEKQYCYFQ